MKAPDNYRARLATWQQLLQQEGLTPASRRSAEGLVTLFRTVLPDAEALFAALAKGRVQDYQVVCAAPRCPRNGEPFTATNRKQRTCSNACRRRLSRAQKPWSEYRAQKRRRSVGNGPNWDAKSPGQGASKVVAPGSLAPVIPMRPTRRRAEHLNERGKSA